MTWLCQFFVVLQFLLLHIAPYLWHEAVYEADTVDAEFLTPLTPHKFYASEEAIWEIQGLHEYIDALALHDLSGGSGLYAATAFDLFHEDLSSAVAGIADWASFFTSTHFAQIP